ncbi:MAG: MarR family transcriptional regulator [Spirochaetes bacterium]|nr:MarR family transcriptional regulator [Spirochaetota bacterium]
MRKRGDTFAFEQAEDSPGFLLWQATSLWQREIRRALVAFDLTHSQFVLIASIHWLTLGGNEVTQATLSQHSKIDPMTVSQVLRALQVRKLVRRRAHSSDTRAKAVELTEAGRGVVHEAVKAVEKFDMEFFAPLGSGLREFNNALKKLIKPGS